MERQLNRPGFAGRRSVQVVRSWLVHAAWHSIALRLRLAVCFDEIYEASVIEPEAWRQPLSF
jgi:hypothetical protein